MNVDSFLQSLSDEEVLDWAIRANDDCIKAGTEEHGSEWHQNCFAAMVLVSGEMTRRGISLSTTH